MSSPLGGRDVSGDPLDEVGRVLALNSLDLLLDLLHRDLSSEVASNSEVSLWVSDCSYQGRATHALSGVGSGHHVLGVKHLLSELGNSDGSVGSGSSGSQGSETDHEEVESRERNHVDTQLSEIRVELTGESKTGGDTRHDERDEVVQVTVSGGVELQGSETDIVKSLVIDTESSVRVLDKLVDGESGVVWLDDSVGDLHVSLDNSPIGSAYLGGGDDGEGAHHPVGVLFPDLRDQERTHTGTGTTTERVGDLETLETVGSLGLSSDDIENRVHKLGTFSVMTLGPVVTSTALAEDANYQLRPPMLGVHVAHKLSGRKRPPRGPPRIESMVPGSKSTSTARGTYLLAATSL
jgi:hypothetical protein